MGLRGWKAIHLGCKPLGRLDTSTCSSSDITRSTISKKNLYRMELAYSTARLQLDESISVQHCMGIKLSLQCMACPLLLLAARTGINVAQSTCPAASSLK